MARSLRPLSWLALALVLALSALPRPAQAEALLLIEADSGKVLHAENATYPWYPASVTKIMTAYVALKAVKDGRLSLDSLFTVSPTAAAQQPSKMGFRPGTQVTLDNALKMMMVKSANDMAVVIAEGVAGSVDNFSAEMNRTAQRLGMTQTAYVNPNGLPAEGQITSARDLGILARAVIRDLPEYEYFMHIPAIKFGRRVTANFNKLIGRYPGADGMKTGFICASGFNLVATATRNDKRLIAVVLGAQSSAQRAVRAAQLLERGFNGNRLSWLKPSLGRVDQLAPVDASPPNLRDEMCGPKRKRPAAEDEDDDVTISADGSGSGSASTDSGAVAMYAAGLQPPAISMKASDLLAAAAAPAAPVIVYTGPARSGAAILEADAAETARQATAREKKKKGAARPKLAAKPDAAGATGDNKGDKKSDKKAEAKPTSAKPASAKPAAAPKADRKPEAAPKQAAAKPASDARPAVKPAAKGDAKAGDAKTAAKPKSESKSEPKAAAKPAAKPAARPDQTKSAAAPKS